MVSTYHIIKLFKKASFQRDQRRIGNDTGSPTDTTNAESQQETIIENKCRICLQKGTLPIYSDQERDIAQDISTFGDIEISEEDDYPKFICNSCLKLLDSAIVFRKTAKICDQILRNASAKTQKSSKAPDLENEENAENSALVLENFFSAVESGSESSRSSSGVSKPVKPRKKLPKVQCRICFKIISKSYYKEHYALHDQTVAKYVCDICGKSFRQRCSYRNHYLTHSSKFPYKCTLCPYRGRHPGLLRTHTQIHKGDYRFMCTECPARFLTKSNLNKHAQKHKEPMFKCDTCQKGFHSKLILERHFEADHLGIKNHICNVCGKAFGYRKAMMRHLLDVHKREKKLNGRTPAYIEAEMNNSEDS